eukprot:5919531-Pleurochrysis_carterae.AAC.3
MDFDAVNSSHASMYPSSAACRRATGNPWAAAASTASNVSAQWPVRVPPSDTQTGSAASGRAETPHGVVAVAEAKRNSAESPHGYHIAFRTPHLSEKGRKANGILNASASLPQLQSREKACQKALSVHVA